MILYRSSQVCNTTYVVWHMYLLSSSTRTWSACTVQCCIECTNSICTSLQYNDNFKLNLKWTTMTNRHCSIWRHVTVWWTYHQIVTTICIAMTYSYIGAYISVERICCSQVDDSMLPLYSPHKEMFWIYRSRNHHEFHEGLCRFAVGTANPRSSSMWGSDLKYFAVLTLNSRVAASSQITVAYGASIK